MSKHFNKEEFLNKTIEWMRQWKYQEFAGAPTEQYIDDVKFCCEKVRMLIRVFEYTLSFACHF